MRITGWDEYPFHQHPLPLGMPATTDPKFNDGYFIAFYGPQWYVVTVLRLHPNVNVLDGAVNIAHADRQRGVRASRALRPRQDELEVGPLRLEIVEPMRTVRLVLDENATGVSFDVVLETQAPPFLESRYQHFKYGALVNDTLRYTQLVRADGRMHADGEALDLRGWYGLRDHSWGVRTSLGVPVRIGGTERTEEEADRRAIRFWVPFQVEGPGGHCGFFNTHEDADGNVLDFEGRLDFADGRSVRLVALEHDLTYVTGTPRPSGGRVALLDEDGDKHTYELRASGSPADVHGVGYYRGWHDGRSSGIWRGVEHLEYDDYGTTPGDEPTGPPHVPVAHRMGPTEYPMFMTYECSAGRAEGMAHLEHHIFGRYARYGF
jgi:hypothetical protein